MEKLLPLVWSWSFLDEGCIAKLDIQFQGLYAVLRLVKFVGRQQRRKCKWRELNKHQSQESCGYCRNLRAWRFFQTFWISTSQVSRQDSVILPVISICSFHTCKLYPCLRHAVQTVHYKKCVQPQKGYPSYGVLQMVKLTSRTSLTHLSSELVSRKPLQHLATFLSRVSYTPGTRLYPYQRDSVPASMGRQTSFARISR